MENQHNEYWARILEVYNQSGCKNITEFANKLGSTRSAALYQIKSGNNKISPKLANNIHSIWPQFSLPWLMFGSSEGLRLQAVPIYEDLLAYIQNRPYKQLEFPVSLCSPRSFGIQMPSFNLRRELEGATVIFEPAGELNSYNHKPLCIIKMTYGVVKFAIPEYLRNKRRFKIYEHGSLSQKPVYREDIDEIYVMSLAFRKFNYIK